MDIHNMDLSKKHILITGATSGIGYETALYCASKKASVIIASRNEEKCKKAVSNIKSIYQDALVDYIVLDLSNLERIDLFVKEYYNKYNKLDILINNAGVIVETLSSSHERFELTFSVSHIGHFVLTAKLLPLLKESSDAKIISTSSLASRFGKIDYDKIMYKEGNKYSQFFAYARAKLANLIFSMTLARKVTEHNLNIKVITTHPGVTKSGLGDKYKNKGWLYKLMLKGFGVFSQPTFNGALPYIYAIIDDSIKHGSYIGPKKLFGTRGKPKLLKARKLVYNEVKQEMLWSYTEDITRTYYQF